MTQHHQTSATKAKIYAALLILMFLIPLLGAIYLYSQREELHLGTTNKGNLITPALDISHLTALYAPEKWMLVYVTAEPCKEKCTKNIYYINQIHTALGKKMNSVTPTIISTEVSQQEIPPADDFPKLKWITLNASDLAWLNQHIPQNFQISDAGNFFLIDPHGFLMMHYPSDTPPKSILKDLQHLIRN